MRLFVTAFLAAIFLLAGISSDVLAGEREDYQVLLFGDSIAAGYGLAPEEALAGQLAKRLGDGGLDVQVRNGGVSGDTTAGGLARVDWTLSGRADLVIIVLGGNDAMRGLTPSQSENNLGKLVKALKSRGLKVLLTGMRAPPNLGPDYAAAFEPMFERVAKEYGATLYPFILEGVAADPDLNQEDGIHPNADGVAVIVDSLAPIVASLLGS